MSWNSAVRVSFRTYIMVLCVLYLMVMLLFHSDIQDSHSNPKHNPKMFDGGVFPPLKGTLGPEPRRPSQNESRVPGQFRKPNIGGYGFRDIGPVPLPNIEVRHVQLRTKFPFPRNCIGKDNGHEYEFHELITDRLFIFSAYFDTRPNDFDNTHNGTYVRIMSVLRWHGNKPDVICIFTTSNGSKLHTPVHFYEMCENHGRPMGGFILSCPVPKVIDGMPCSVVVSKPWSDEEAYNMKILPLLPEENRNQFAICVPPLYGNINERKLVEFVEMSRLLGAQRVTFYDYKVTEETAKVLEYYQSRDLIEVVPWLYPDTLERWSWYHGQMIAIQDCLYRNMHSAEYVTFNDIDEYVVPHVHSDWLEMTEALFQPSHCAYQIPSAFFPPPPPFSNESIVLAATSRSLYLSNVRTKCMVKPYLIFESGIHHISKPIWAHLKVVRMPESVAFLHHYRLCMRDFAMNCKEHVEDLTLHRYKDVLKRNTRNALKDF